MALDDFPRTQLLFGPSPIHPLRRLSEYLGGEVEIWAKREDCNSGIAFGGNKVRKLEYLVADALSQACDTLVSIGGIQSNHTRAVTGVAAHLGLKAVTVQERWVDWPDVVYDKVGNIQLTRIMGGDVRIDPAGFDIGIRDSWQRALASVEEAGGKPYPIPAGASDHPLGGLGFANWAREVADQENALGIYFDTVVVCTVTGSTHAGMIAGFAKEGRGRRVIGIDASATLDKTREQLFRIASATAEKIELDRQLTDDDVELVEGYAAGIYGIAGRRDDRRHPHGRSTRRDVDGPRLRGEVDGGTHRHGPLRRDPRRIECALRTSRRSACSLGVRRSPVSGPMSG